MLTVVAMPSLFAEGTGFPAVADDALIAVLPLLDAAQEAVHILGTHALCSAVHSECDCIAIMYC